MGQNGERRFSIDPLSLCALRRVGFGKERKACASGPFWGLEALFAGCPDGIIIM